jgi:hypothetical protein
MNDELPGRGGALLAASAAALCLAAVPARAQDAGGQPSAPSSSTAPSSQTTPSSPAAPSSPTAPSQTTATTPSAPSSPPNAAYTPDPNPYYIGVGQGFTHDSNVYRIPSGPGDWYSSTTVFGGFDQPISRQRVFGRAGVSLNRYSDQTQLNNTSYDLSLGADLETIEHISGSVNVGLSQNLASASATFGAPSAGRNLQKTERADGRLRWGGPSLLSIEGGLSYVHVDYSAPQFVTSETRETTATLGMYYRPSPILRVGLGYRYEYTETPKALFDPNSSSYTPNSTDGNNIDLTADYTPDAQLKVNGRLSYTRQTNSVIATSDFSGFTGSLAVSWQPTAKTSVVFDASRDAGFEANSLTQYAIVQSGTGLTLTPVSVVYQNNRVTDSVGLAASYAATAKINTSAGLRYTRARLAGAVQAGLDARNVDVSKTATASVGYAITRAWNANCTVGYETRDVTAIVTYSYTATVIGCATQFTWH